MPMKLFIYLLLFGLCSLVWAQGADSFSVGRLSEAEQVSLRAQLKAVLPTGASRDQVDNHFKVLDNAAIKLGDVPERERVLREWNLKSTSLGARWVLASFLLGTEKADEGLQRSEALLAEMKNPQEKVRLISDLAIFYIDQSNLKRAETLLKDAAETIKTEFPSRPYGPAAYWHTRAEMEFYNIQGRLYMRQGRFVEALNTSILANAKGDTLRAYEALVDERARYAGRQNHVWTFNEHAQILISMGRLLEADDVLRQAYALCKSYGFAEYAMIGFYRRLAELRFSEGQYAEAIKVYQKIKEIQIQQGVHPSSAQMLYTRTGIARALVAAKKWQEATVEFSEMDAAAGNSPQLANIARHTEFRAQVYMNMGFLGRARSLMNGTLKWHVENFGPHHYYTAITRGLYAVTLTTDSNENGKARSEFEVAIRDMTAPNVLSTDYQENGYRKSLKTLILKSYLQLLTASESRTDADSAEAFKVANHLIASSVQQAIAESAARSGIKQPDLAVLVRKDQDAKNELSALYAYIAAQNGEGASRRTPEVVSSMRGRIKALEDLRSDMKERVQTEFPEYFQLLQPKVPGPTELAAKLRPDELFISVLPMDDATYVFAVASNGKLAFSRSKLTQSDIAEKVRRIRATLDVADQGARAPAFDAKSAYELYTDLLLPMESAMSGKRHLIVAASGALGQLPFAVLPTAAVRQVKNQEPSWLIKRYALSSVPSANAWMSLQQLSKTPSANRSMMAWGDPQFRTDAQGARASTGVASNSTRAVVTSRNDMSFDLEKPRVDVLRYSELPPLPETRDEVIALGKTLGADAQTDIFVGNAATRASVLNASADGRLSHRQVVVFATHGLLPGDLPNLDQPALALASTNQKDALPLLTLDDVMSLRMNADWVVLSACNTASADGRAEEAMSGLARGFFYAGSRSLLVTHWSVESESAMLLTTATFAAYQSSPDVTRAEALRTAMLKVMAMKPYKHPAFWAPYALVGEGGR